MKTKSEHNCFVQALRPRVASRLVSFAVAILAGWLCNAGSLTAAEVITGRAGQANNHAVVNFETMAALEKRFSRTNEGQHLIPPPMPGTTNVQDRRSGQAMAPASATEQVAAAPFTPPPGGFSAQPSPLPSATFQGLDDNGFYTPPDTHGAVGLDHLMVAVNRGIRIQDRTGANLSTTTLQGFWSTLRVLDVFDPKVFYDAAAQRWIMTSAAESFSRRSSILIGVSQSSNPRGRWNLYRIDADSDDVSWADFPSVGFNKDWIVVTVNMFPFTGFGRDYTGVNIYAFNKQDLYTNGLGRFTLFQENSGRGFTMCPAVVQDPFHPTMYLVESDNLVRNYLISSSQLRLSTITGAVGAEVLTVGTAVVDPANPWGSSDPFLLFTGSVPQLGSFFGLDGGDSRIGNVIFRNGSLWATHTAWTPSDAPERTAIQWYQISPGGSIIQYGRLEDTNQVNYYAYPSIAVNRNNDVLLGFSKFSTNSYPSAAYAFRSCDDPPGTFRTDYVYKPGEGPYFPFGFTNFLIVGRWGDYSATVVDPRNDVDMWTLQEYAPARFGFWDTWWAQVTVDTSCSQVAFTLSEYKVREGAAPGLATIDVLNLGGQAGSVDFATSDGTAVAGVDYLSRSGTLNFSAGQTSTNFTIVILDDPFTNGNRTVNLTLSNPGGGAQLGFLSNAVLTIEDDEAVVLPNIAGEFNFSSYFKDLPYSDLYLATENETCLAPCGDDDYVRYRPDRTAYGVLVTVVRTNGNTGRVMIDYETALGGSAIPNVDYTPTFGTLVFDNLQTSTNFLVQVRSDFFTSGGFFNFFSFVRLVLSNPRPAPEEEAIRPGVIQPSLGPGSESGIIIWKINNGFLSFSGGNITSNAWINWERVNHRVDEYPNGQAGSGFPCSFGSIVDRSGNNIGGFRAFAVNITSGGTPVSGTIRVRTSDDASGVVLLNPDFQAGSEQAVSPDNGATVYGNPVFTDPTLTRITNFADYVSIGGTNIITFANECRKSVIVLVTNDPTVEFNEDIVVLLDPRPNDLLVGPVFDTHITIVADDQPAGAVDREWNPPNVAKSDPPFNTVPGANGYVNAVAVQGDGKTVLCGDFTAVNAKPRNRIARMNSDGTLDLSFNPGSGANQFVSGIALYPSNALVNAGKLLIGGAFSSINGTSRRGIARLNGNGSVDSTFTPGNGVNVDGVVRSVALQPDGKILIAGDFYEYDDQPRNGFARLNADGSIDTTFDIGVGADGSVSAVAFTPDPFSGFKVVVGGEFSSINGEFRPGVAQLNPDGSVDPNFNPGGGVNGPVYALAVQTNGSIIIAGLFNDFNAVRRDNIVRLNSDGTLDATFDPGSGSDDAIYSTVLQPDGKCLIGGVFTSYNGTRRLGIARLRYNGTLDTSIMDTAYNEYAGLVNGLSWEPPNFVKAMALQPDGNVIIGGSFTTLGGNPSEDAALRNTWTVFTRADKTTRYNIARLIGGITPGPGNAEFDDDNYYVDENAGTAFVRLQRTDGRLGSLSALATNSTSSATGTETDPANADFVSTNRFNTWSEHTGDAPRPRSVGNVGSVFFRIPILDDSLREGDEQMDLTFLRPDGSVTLGGQPILLGGALGRPHARLTISDNDRDPGIFNFLVSVFQTNENAGSAIITIIRTNGTDGQVSVDYRTRPSETFPATAAVDYWPIQGRATFAQGQTNYIIRIPLTNDTFVEFDEYVDLVLTNALGGAKLPGGTPTSTVVAKLRIVDDDFPPGRLNFIATAFTNAETDGSAVIAVNRTGGSMDAVSVQYETVNTGSAAIGSDYGTVTGTLSWANGESGPKTFSVPLFTDGMADGDKSLRVHLLDPRVRGVPSSTLLGALTNSILVIRDSDFPGSVAFAQPLYQADENASAVTINLIRSGGVAGPGTITFSAQPDSAIAGVDFVPVTTNVTFASGQIGAAVTLRLLDDSQGDGNKSVALRLSNPVGVTLGALSSVTLLLVDNESFNENPGSGDTAFNRDTETDGPIYSMALQSTNGVIDGRIVIAGEFTEVNHVPRSGLGRLMTNGALDASFNVGDGPNNPARAVAIQPDGKLLVGGFFTQFNNTNCGRIARLHIDGTLDAFFNTGSGADLPVYAIVIQPDEKILVVGAFNLFAGISRPMIVRLNTNGAVDQAFGSISGPNDKVYAVALQADGKVVIGGEFTMVGGVPRNRLARLNRDGSLDLSFDTSTGFDAPVRSILVQADGKIVVGGSFLNANNMARGYLARLERDGTLDGTFMNGLSGANNAVYALSLQVDGKIVVGGDFTGFNGVTRNRITRLNSDGANDTTINFGSGANAFITSLLVQPDRKIMLAGGFTEYDDQPRLRIARVHGGSVAGPGSITFSREFFNVGENQGEVLITVKRTGGTTGAVGVDYQTFDDTAIAGTHYRATNGTLTFGDGETISGFRVAILDNNVTNDDRVIGLLLSGYSGGATSGAQPSARIIIANDESAVGFTQDTYTAGENSISGNATLTLRRGYATNNFLAVNFATVPGGTATPGLDYLATNGTVTFLPGELVRNFNIRLINDTNIEGNETVRVVISNPTATSGSAPALQRTNATLTIVEDDFGPGQFIFERGDYTVREDGVSANLTIVRTNGSTGVVSVRYRTVDNSALGGSDFVATNSVLAFADGETRKTLSIIIFEDNAMEGTEDFNVQLSNATGGAAIGSPSSARINILDNDTNLIVSAGAYLVAESGPVNSFIDAGETVTVSFGLRNVGTASTSNLVATLQNNANVTPTAPFNQNYGQLLANGEAVFRNFSFTANGIVGSRLITTLALSDGAQNYGLVSYAFTLGGRATNNPCNTNAIILNDSGAGSVYPSSITLANVGGVVTKVTVTLNQVRHTFPDDVDVLLEAPNGQTVMLMSDAGGGNEIAGATITFDDAASIALPDSGIITSGAYRPANYAGSPTSDSFPLPAPQPVSGGFSPYTNTALSAFVGSSPNGAWKLYVVDDTGFDSGSIAGWCLAVVSGDPLSTGTDVVLTGQDTPDPIFVGGQLTYRWAITNVGSSAATDVIFTSPIPPNTTFISAISGNGTPIVKSNKISHSFSSLPAGTGNYIQMVVQPNVAGVTISNTSTLQLAETDLNPANNSLTLTTSVQAPGLAILRSGSNVVLSWPAAASAFVLQQSDELAPPTWRDVSTQPQVVGNQKRVTLPIVVTCRCYRLRN